MPSKKIFLQGKPYNEEFGMPLNDFIHTNNPHYWKHGNLNETEVEFSERLGKSLEDLITEVYEIVGTFAFERIDQILQQL